MHAAANAAAAVVDVRAEPGQRRIPRGDALVQQPPQLGQAVARPRRHDEERNASEPVVREQALGVLRARRRRPPADSRSAWFRTTAIEATCEASGRR